MQQAWRRWPLPTGARFPRHAQTKPYLLFFFLAFLVEAAAPLLFLAAFFFLPKTCDQFFEYSELGPERTIGPDMKNFSRILRGWFCV